MTIKELEKILEQENMLRELKKELEKAKENKIPDKGTVIIYKR